MGDLNAEVGCEKIIKRIGKQQATFVGHILRRKGLEHLVITEKMEGRR